MTEIDLNDYVAGGYFITKYVDRAEWMPAALLPNKLLIISRQTLAPVNPALNPSADKYSAYGMLPPEESGLAQWHENNLNVIGWARTFLELEEAEKFIERFITRVDEVVILGVAVHRKWAHLLKPDDDGVVSSCGVETVIVRDQAPLPGKVLGFDVLSYEYCDFESWIYLGYPEVINQELDIKFNEYGYLSSQEEADRVDAFMEKDDDMALHGWWLPWLIIQYPIKSESA